MNLPDEIRLPLHPNDTAENALGTATAVLSQLNLESRSSKVTKMPNTYNTYCLVLNNIAEKPKCPREALRDKYGVAALAECVDAAALLAKLEGASAPPQDSELPAADILTDDNLVDQLHSLAREADKRHLLYSITRLANGIHYVCKPSTIYANEAEGLRFAPNHEPSCRGAKRVIVIGP